jgi:hypothetical protein
LQSKAKTGVDDQGRPVLEVQVGERRVQIGMAADNVLSGNPPPELVRQLLEARLQAELRRSPQALSEGEIERDWGLLQKTLVQSDSRVAIRLATRSENIVGNRP